MIEIKNKKISKNEFMDLREEALKGWYTGKDVDLEDSFEFHHSLEENKIFSKKLIKAKENNQTLVQPRAGVALVDEQIKLLSYLQNEGQADLLPTTIDSYTRQNAYEDAQKGIMESIKNNKSMLNGFPAVNHGVDSCRRIIKSLDIPVQVRHGTPDARLLSEITYAGGFTSFEGGGISYNIPYAKNVSLESTLRNWQYVDRLTGLYVIITTVLHQWMGSFPQDEAKAFGVIALGSVLASLSKATKVIVKTPHEAMGVPTKEANAQGLLCTKQVLYMLKDQEFNNKEVKFEKEIIKKETRCIVDKCFEIGENDIAIGVIRAFKSGTLDIPFAPSVHTMGKILPVRDNNGAIRILNPGKIPFTKEILDFNNKKIEERASYEHREKSFQMVIDDVYAISKGTLIGRPRNK